MVKIYTGIVFNCCYYHEHKHLLTWKYVLDISVRARYSEPMCVRAPMCAYICKQI